MLLESNPLHLIISPFSIVGIGFGGLWRFAGPFTKVLQFYVIVFNMSNVYAFLRSFICNNVVCLITNL